MNSIRFLLVYGWFAVFALQASAQSLGISYLPLSETHRKDSVTNASLTLEQNDYVSAHETYFGSDARAQNTNLKLQIQDQERLLGPAFFKGDVSDEWSSADHWNYLDVHELYLGYKMTNASLSIGRKLETWAQWEDEWRQGSFQPRYLENGLRPELAGLTGVFAQVHGDKLRFVGGFLPINIPEFGPHFSVRDDKFYSPNPWFKAPASELLYLDVANDLHYTLESPNTGDILLKAGGVAKVEYQDAGFSTRASYAYKPATQLALGFPSEGLYEFPQYLKITIHARTIYDRIANYDAAYSTGAWRFAGSVAYDNPVGDTGPENWTAQVFAPAWIYTGSIERRLEDAGPHAARVELGVFKVAGDDARDHGRFGVEGETKFSRRYQYYEAYLLGLNKEFRLGGERTLRTSMRAIYDRLQNGGVLSFESAYAFNANWRADLQLDFLGLMSDAPAKISDGFLANFRANDRVGLGVSYVF